MKTVMTPWKGMLCCASILLASLAIFHLQASPEQLPEWQVHHYDHGDYRFIAEHFWGMPHNAASYGPEFAGHWGAYLERVPFRDIGVGTWYLAVHGTLQTIAPHSTIEYEAILMRSILQLSIALCTLGFAWAVMQRAGPITAILITTACALPTSMWHITDEMLSEPLLRCGFLILAAATLSLGRRKIHGSGVVLIAMLIILPLLKSQWLLLSWGMAIAFGIQMACKGQWREAILSTTAIALVTTAALSWTHRIGWGTTALFVGSGLHANLESNGEYLRTFCAKEPTMELCNPGPSPDPYWNIRTDSGVPTEEFARLDEGSTAFMIGHRPIVQAALSAAAAMTNFPSNTAEPWLLMRILNIATWLLLLFGLTHRRTFLAAACALGMWCVPIAASILAVFDMRYTTPMAGITLGIALTIAIERKQVFRSVIKTIRTAEWAAPQHVFAGFLQAEDLQGQRA